MDLEFRARDEWLRVAVGVHASYDVAYHVDRAQYDQATIDQYQWLLRLGETYFAFAFDHVELVVGAQKVVFGSGELLSVLDVANPRDLRDPGITDPADIRLPVAMTRLSVFGGSHRVDLIAVHEAYFQVRPAPLSFFSPIRKVLLADTQAGSALPPELVTATDLNFSDEPSRFGGLAAQQGLARYGYSGSAVEFGAYGGTLIEYPGVTTWAGELGPNPLFVRIPLMHPRYTMVGASLATPINDWLIYLELAADIERPVQLADLQATGFGLYTFERRSLFRWLAGVRFGRPGAPGVSVEYSQGTHGDVLQERFRAPFEPLFPINPATLAARYAQGFARDRHAVEVVAVSFGPSFKGGGLVRGQATHELVSDLHLTWGYIAYFEGSVRSPTYGFNANHRFFLRFRWDFGTP